MMKTNLNLLNNLDTDFKVITKAAEMIENGEVEADQVMLLPMGGRKTAYAKDMGGHSVYYSESRHQDCLLIDLNREGLYDMLPEGLFHQPPTGSAGYSEEEMVEDVQRRRAEEKDARKFFMPFEAELNHLRTIVELYENRLDKRTSYNDLTRIFAAKWREFDLLDNEQGIIWMNLLPLINERRNDLSFLGELLSLLFKIPFSVTPKSGLMKTAAIADHMQFRLGSGNLGINTIIGASFSTDAEEIVIHIGPADTTRLIQFMPETPNAYLINLAISYLIPVETECTIELLAAEKDKVAALGADSNNSFLGFTVYL
jgi:hypothetical protein